MYALTQRAAEVQAASEINVAYTQAEFIYGEDPNGRRWVRAEGPNGYSSKYYYA